MSVNYLLGLDKLISCSSSCPPRYVASPISILPVVAISNLQNTSSPQISLAFFSRTVSEKEGSYTGMNDGK